MVKAILLAVMVLIMSSNVFVDGQILNVETDFTTISAVIVTHNQKDGPPIKYYITPNGYVRQLDFETTHTTQRKMVFSTQSNLTIENIDKSDISKYQLHTRAWQLPINSGLLIKQFPTINGNIQHDFAKYYVLHTGYNSLIEVQWIRSGFIPMEITYPGDIILRWNKSPELDVFAYNIYISIQESEGPFDLYGAKSTKLPDFTVVKDENNNIVYYGIGKIENLPEKYKTNDYIKEEVINKIVKNLTMTKNETYINDNFYEMKLEKGKYHIAVSAINLSGIESDFTEVTYNVD